jgi:hypothetical protein
MPRGALVLALTLSAAPPALGAAHEDLPAPFSATDLDLAVFATATVERHDVRLAGFEPSAVAKAFLR